tara:strand:+ start:93 stop:485 length:393 start_codon:yes stop_codon:yes gene_type:complete
MMDPDRDFRRYMVWTFVLILFLLVSKLAIASEKVYYNDIKTLKPGEVDDQYCYVKIVITEKDDVVTKEEILECADGRKRFDSPGYWEMFAQFYYRDVNTPEYCRFYSRPGHAFKSFGKVCMNKNGEWEVK